MKHVRKRLTYANVMSSIAVFLVLGGATAFAATKIGANEIKANSIKTGKIVKEAVTQGKIKAGAVGNSRLGNGSVSASKLATSAVINSAIADNAVTTGKIADNAVTSSKIANGAVTPAKLSEQYLPAGTVGVPIAGANISSTGEVRRFFNRSGGAPSVTHTVGTGSYTITFPGLEGKAFFDESIVLVSLNQSSPGEISRTSSGGNPTVLTYSSAGAGADHAFEIVIFVPNP